MYYEYRIDHGPFSQFTRESLGCNDAPIAQTIYSKKSICFLQRTHCILVILASLSTRKRKMTIPFSMAYQPQGLCGAIDLYVQLVVAIGPF